MKTIFELLDLIDEPNRSGCIKLYIENKELLDSAYGSTHNHQSWKGGYMDHIVDGMNIILHQYELLSSFDREIPFSLSDALLIFWLHDIEKPWKIVKKEDGKSDLSNYKNLHKDQFDFFKIYMIEKYKIELTDYQYEAYKYVEGEKNDYSSGKRVMNELAAFCHCIDVISARIWYDYPKETEK